MKLTLLFSLQSSDIRNFHMTQVDFFFQVYVASLFVFERVFERHCIIDQVADIVVPEIFRKLSPSLHK